MPRNANIPVPADTWTEITSGDVTAIRIQNLTGHSVWIKGTVGAVAPTDIGGGILLQSLDVIAADLSLASLFPGVTGANRVYAYFYSGDGSAASLSVSHA